MQKKNFNLTSEHPSPRFFTNFPNGFNKYRSTISNPRVKFSSKAVLSITPLLVVNNVEFLRKNLYLNLNA